MGDRLTTTDRAHWDVECACGEGALIACDPDGFITDGDAVECPGCGHTIAVSCGPDSGAKWTVHYDRQTSNGLCATYHEAGEGSELELMRATQ